MCNNCHASTNSKILWDGASTISPTSLTPKRNKKLNWKRNLSFPANIINEKTQVTLSAKNYNSLLDDGFHTHNKSASCHEVTKCTHNIIDWIKVVTWNVRGACSPHAQYILWEILLSKEWDVLGAHSFKPYVWAAQDYLWVILTCVDASQSTSKHSIMDDAEQLAWDSLSMEVLKFDVWTWLHAWEWSRFYFSI